MWDQTGYRRLFIRSRSRPHFAAPWLSSAPATVLPPMSLLPPFLPDLNCPMVADRLSQPFFWWVNAVLKVENSC